MLVSVMIGVVSANFWRDFTFFTRIPAAVTSTTLPFVHFGKDIDFVGRRMDLVLAILFDSLAEKVFAIKTGFLLCEGVARN